VLLTSWAIVHMRQWKFQVPALARRFRVVTVEGRGNGAADRPKEPAAYADRELVADAVAVMDAVGVDRAVLVGLSMGGRHALQLAAWYPDRAAGVVTVGTALPWPLPPGFDEVRDSYRGLGEGEPALLARRLPRLGRVLHVEGVQRAALDQAVGGRRRLRPGDGCRDPAAHG
jgi:pimeloyl-ACP methyl ester carboxylesterase